MLITLFTAAKGMNKNEIQMSEIDIDGDSEYSPKGNKLKKLIAYTRMYKNRCSIRWKHSVYSKQYRIVYRRLLKRAKVEMVLE